VIDSLKIYKNCLRRAKYGQAKIITAFLFGDSVPEIAGCWCVYENDIEDILRAHIRWPHKKKRGR
jgi:hypothetical protein